MISFSMILFYNLVFQYTCFHLGFPTKILYASVMSPLFITFPHHSYHPGDNTGFQEKFKPYIKTGQYF
jgi:hypothetical protein